MDEKAVDQAGNSSSAEKKPNAKPFRLPMSIGLLLIVLALLMADFRKMLWFSLHRSQIDRICAKGEKWVVAKTELQKLGIPILFETGYEAIAGFWRQRPFTLSVPIELLAKTNAVDYVPHMVNFWEGRTGVVVNIDTSGTITKRIL